MNDRQRAWSSRRCAAAVIAFATIAALDARAARAAEVAAALDYGAAPGCPDGEVFEAVVARHLGYSPFRADALRRVIVRVEPSDRSLEGRVEWRNDAGGWAGERRFPSRTGDCGELVRAMGFALAVQFQLLASEGTAAPEVRPEATRGPPPPPAVTVVAPPPAVTGQPGAPSGARSRPALTIGAGASAGVGLSPEITALGRVFGSVAWSHVALELAGEISVPSTLRRTDGAGFSEQVFLAGLAGCGVDGRWNACALAKVGEVRVVGQGVDVPATASGPLIQAGLRLAVTQMLGQRARIALHADGLALLTRGTVTLDAKPVWTTPRAAASLGLDLGVRFQ